ncbi:hypothetical protein M413DRAFT_446719 [Hebeloma cylindrosporum]|uniref:Uncharacterized protein n=1 Tax=Hebeloma cylindrosporum TaxID=76867 RepID=A0A0C2XQ94_HEBCY|nr:hypothetical protein M413DRAFT_446719 [Hebeloma cylindrosporum h7]
MHTPGQEDAYDDDDFNFPRTKFATIAAQPWTPPTVLSAEYSPSPLANHILEFGWVCHTFTLL